MSFSLDEATKAIIASGRRLDAHGLAAATSGNYSARLADGRVAITVSGRHKGRLGPDDIMLVDQQGTALQDKKPSAETALHTLIYRLFPQINAVLHVHSVAGVALTRYLPTAREIVLDGYEMLKAFPGISTHQATVRLPVYENTQDMPSLAEVVSRRLQASATVPAYLIRGHGEYGWGKDLEEAERIIEALEHLLQCELEALRLKGGNA